MDYRKPKSAAKKVIPRGEELRGKVLKTLDVIAKVVGGTLGPAGRPVLIERYEHDLPPFISKDGVTVFRALGFEDAVMHCIMEMVRQVAVRTATEAGDGTTTATILAAAIVSSLDRYCETNGHTSPQAALREIEQAFRDEVEPTVAGLAVRASLAADGARLRAVARVSANGDDALAGAVLEAFGVCGDDGNVTLLETVGHSGYSVERVAGFPIGQGYENIGKLYSKFLSDQVGGRTRLDGPCFILYHGELKDAAYLAGVLETLGQEWQAGTAPREYVLAATGFGEQVLGLLAAAFQHPGSIRVFPLIAPQSPVLNSQLSFLEDLAAVTGATVYDRLHAPLDGISFEGVGAYQDEVVKNGEPVQVWRSHVHGFEAGRYRSTVFGHVEGQVGSDAFRTAMEDLEEERVARVELLREAMAGSESEMDLRYLQERLAKLSGGIARLRIAGPSSVETKEKRDRAEDAVCAVRGALKHGLLPGGGWTLLRLAAQLGLPDRSAVVRDVLAPALERPIQVLFENAGYTPEQIAGLLVKVRASAHPQATAEDAVVFDLLLRHHVLALEEGVLDSVPAVLEAVRNALSMAGVGALSGVVVYPRDHQLERDEAGAEQEFGRHANYVDEHA